jgi:hypothetical protein
MSPSCRDFSRCGLGGRRFTFLARYDFTGQELPKPSPTLSIRRPAHSFRLFRVHTLAHLASWIPLSPRNVFLPAPIALRIYAYVTPTEPPCLHTSPASSFAASSQTSLYYTQDAAIAPSDRAQSPSMAPGHSRQSSDGLS